MGNGTSSRPAHVQDGPEPAPEPGSVVTTDAPGIVPQGQAEQQASQPLLALPPCTNSAATIPTDNESPTSIAPSVAPGFEPVPAEPLRSEGNQLREKLLEQDEELLAEELSRLNDDQAEVHGLRITPQQVTIQDALSALENTLSAQHVVSNGAAIVPTGKESPSAAPAIPSCAPAVAPAASEPVPELEALSRLDDNLAEVQHGLRITPQHVPIEDALSALEDTLSVDRHASVLSVESEYKQLLSVGGSPRITSVLSI